MISPDPGDWTPAQRTAYLADALSELLDTVPTEQTAWGAPELVRGREEEAKAISSRMDAVLEAGRKPKEA